MIAERDRVDPGRDQFAVDEWRESGSAGGVLRVGDDQVEPSRDDPRQDPADDVAARFADDVADEQDSHGQACAEG